MLHLLMRCQSCAGNPAAECCSFWSRARHARILIRCGPCRPECCPAVTACSHWPLQWVSCSHCIPAQCSIHQRTCGQVWMCGSQHCSPSPGVLCVAPAVDFEAEDDGPEKLAGGQAEGRAAAQDARHDHLDKKYWLSCESSRQRVTSSANVLRCNTCCTAVNAPAQVSPCTADP